MARNKNSDDFKKRLPRLCKSLDDVAARNQTGYFTLVPEVVGNGLNIQD
jgi:hypothetical protein